MSRSVVTKGVERCERCRFAFRWCICRGFRSVECPLRVDVLMHLRETWRPTSTGRLINRVISSSRSHVYGLGAPLDREAIVDPDRTLWILHPQGEPPPAGVPASSVQVLLLDGNWREAARLRKIVEPWGRTVRLPAAGPSRYRLRRQHEDGRYSTIEALALLLDGFGLTEAAGQLRVQFELHVYAGLRARGATGEAEAFLAGSSLPQALPEVLRELRERRRCGRAR